MGALANAPPNGGLIINDQVVRLLYKNCWGDGPNEELDRFLRRRLDDRSYIKFFSLLTRAMARMTAPSQTAEVRR